MDGLINYFRIIYVFSKNVETVQYYYDDNIKLFELKKTNRHFFKKESSAFFFEEIYLGYKFAASGRFSRRQRAKHF
jgi:hypothetical protein